MDRIARMLEPNASTGKRAGEGKIGVLGPGWEKEAGGLLAVPDRQEDDRLRREEGRILILIFC